MATKAHGMKRSPEEVEREIEERRARMGSMLDELAYRRARALNWKTHVKHAAPKMARGMALFGGVAAAVRMLRRWRSRRHATA